MEAVYITDIAAWCGIKHADPSPVAGGISWGPSRGEGNPLIWAHNLYLNGELVTDLVVPGSVPTVENYAFRGATCLKSVTFEEGVETLGDMAFNSCTSLEVIRIPKSLKSADESAFSNILNKNHSTSLYITDWEQFAQNNIGVAFSSNGSWLYEKSPMMDVHINNNRVEDLVIPEGITHLLSNALSYLNVKTITLPRSLESVSSDNGYAVYQCDNLTTVYSKARFAPSGKGLYSNDDLKRIYVPHGSGTNYRTKWTQNSDIIVEVPKNTIITGTQTAENIEEIKQAYGAVNDVQINYIDLTAATLDETVTSETLKKGDTNSNTLYFLPTGTTNITGRNIVVNGKAAEVVLADGQPFSTPKAFEAASAVYSRTQGVGNVWGTLCLPFSCDVPAGITVEEFDKIDAEGSSVIFKPVTKIEAGKAYLFKADDGVSEVKVAAETVQIPVTADLEGKTAEFVGVLSQRITFDSDFREPGCTYYGINAEANEFQRLGEKATCAPFRAYLKITATDGSLPTQARAYKVIHGGGDGTTGISDICNGDADVIYNINGQRMTAPQKGLNIINGKKVIVK